MATETITSTSNNQVLSGGSSDTLFVVNHEGVSVTDAGGVDTVETALSTFTLPMQMYQWDPIKSVGRYSGIENLTYTGTGNFTGSGNELANQIVGGSGNDTLTGSSSYGAYSDAADTLAGGAGDDTYRADTNDIIVEDANGGIDTVSFIAPYLSPNTLVPTQVYTLGANLENLTYTYLGSGVAFHGIGNSLDNTMTDITSLATTLEGGAGNDTYFVGDNDLVIEGEDSGNDTVVLTGVSMPIYDPSNPPDINAPPPSYTLGENIENLTYTGYSRVHVVGNDLANFITVDPKTPYSSVSVTFDGGAGADTLIAGNGNDTLSGGLGADSLVGGGGRDILDGGQGADILKGGDGDDTYIVDNLGDQIVELPDDAWGYDSVYTTLNSYTLGDNLENLTFTGTGSFVGRGNDLSNIITGGDGNDILYGGSDSGETDYLDGGKGDDLYSVHVGSYIWERADEGFDTVEFTGESYGSYAWMSDNVEVAKFVGTGSVYLSGNDLSNIITTGSGDDTIYGGGGADTMSGGAGSDTYYVENAGDIVVESANGGHDQVTSSLANYELAANVEDLTLAYGYGDLNAIGNSLSNAIFGNEGRNVIDGSAGNDTIFGGSGDDHLSGGADDDILTGGAGNDTLDGGTGSDVADYFGSRQDYAISKNADGSVTIRDLWTNDGNDGTDIISGVEAFHFRDGLVTIESLFPVTPTPTEPLTPVTPPPTTPTPTEPQPPVTPPPPPPPPPVTNMTVSGSGASEYLYGNVLNDTLYGSGGNDRLFGLDGNDRLYGGTGKDYLYGGAGKDAFVFNTKPSKTTNYDKIMDFNVRDDSVYLENSIFKALGKSGSATKPALLKTDYFYAGTAAHDANDHIIYNKATGAIYYDADGTGASQQVLIATVKKGLGLTYKDFYVI